VDEFLVWVERILRRYDLTMHFLGAPLVELDDATHARVETYGMSFHRAASGPPERNLVTGFRFVDRFERRDGVWRIAQRIAVTEGARIDREQAWWPTRAGMARGRRARPAPVYEP